MVYPIEGKQWSKGQPIILSNTVDFAALEYDDYLYFFATDGSKILCRTTYNGKTWAPLGKYGLNCRFLAGIRRIKSYHRFPPLFSKAGSTSLSGGAQMARFSTRNIDSPF
jgi:hypothetical protein